MKITTLTEMKMEAYLFKDGEIITYPLSGNRTNAWYYRDIHYKKYNHSGSTMVFFDEEGKTYVLPIPGNTLAKFEKILQSNGYEQIEISVPLANGFNYPELQDKWEAVKARIKLIA